MEKSLVFLLNLYFQNFNSVILVIIIEYYIWVCVSVYTNLYIFTNVIDASALLAH